MKKLFLKSMEMTNYPLKEVYHALEPGHEALFRYHLAYQTDIYPDYFYLHDSSNDISSHHLSIKHVVIDKINHFKMKIRVKNSDLSFDMYLCQKEQKVIEKKAIMPDAKTIAACLNILNKKTDKTLKMLAHLALVNGKDFDSIKEEHKEIFINCFKSSKKHLLLVILFFDEENVKKIAQYIVKNQPKLLSMFDNFATLKEDFFKQYRITQEQSSLYESKDVNNANKMLEKEMIKILSKLDIINDMYLPIRLSQTLNQKNEKKRMKI